MAIGRTVRRAATGAVLAAGVAALAAAYVLRRPVPRSRGRLAVKGLRGGAEILRDRWGVPHIYASTLHDLYFACGYAQAQDRLCQMDLTRRRAGGRLSEIFGQQALEVDRLVRRMGFHRVAQREWESATEEEREVLETFSAGVNAYIERCQLPLEFTVLRYRPERWQPLDSLAFGHFLGWTLAGNWDSEIVRSWTIERFGADLIPPLEPRYPEGGPLIAPPGAEAHGTGPDLAEDFARTQEV